jgi:hypothetical protein
VTDEVADENNIVAVVRALEAANEPLRPREWPALADAQLREQVALRLRGLGRQLLPVMDEPATMVGGYLSTWSDEAAEVLARDPNGLGENDLALLTLIYLHSEVLGRILGEEVRPVAEQLDAHEGRTGRDAIQGDNRKESRTRLRARQLVTVDSKMGTAFRRLTSAQRQRLDENLVLLLRPDSVWAQSIRESRQAVAASEDRS